MRNFRCLITFFHVNLKHRVQRHIKADSNQLHFNNGCFCPVVSDVSENVILRNRAFFFLSFNVSVSFFGGLHGCSSHQSLLCAIFSFCRSSNNNTFFFPWNVLTSFPIISHTVCKACFDLNMFNGKTVKPKRVFHMNYDSQ